MIAKGVRSLRGNATDGGHKSAGRKAEDENHNSSCLKPGGMAAMLSLS